MQTHMWGETPFFVVVGVGGWMDESNEWGVGPPKTPVGLSIK